MLIRTKLLYGYGLAFLVAIVIGNALLYLVVRSTIETDIEKELETTTRSILNMVQTATDVSIKNHLRAVAEKNRDVVRHFHMRSVKGEMTREQAQARAAEVLLSQPIGTTGYIYAVDSKGIMKVHPKKELINTDLSNFAFIREQMTRREGYVEYDWANPGETTKRPKTLYMTHFEPWDWIISASSYRDEFTQLFDVNDFRESILSITFGKTGYPYVIDTRGNLIIHPALEGTNIYDSTDSSGRKFIQELCEKKNGKIIYPWKNPGEPEPREKLVIFNYIPEIDWIVASSSYLEEFYEPLRTIGYVSAAMVLITLGLIIPVTWWLSRSITRPIQNLTNDFALGAQGDYSQRLRVDNGGEIGLLASYYNRFMDQLAASRSSLEESEEKYRGIVENAMEGVFQTSLDGRFISANPAMARLLGYANEEDLIKEITDVQHQLYVDPEDRSRLLRILKERGWVREFETRFNRRDDRVIWASLNARISRDENGAPKYIEGLLTDVTLRRESEEALRRAKEELEQRVAERTAELSARVRELGAVSAQRKQLQNMGQMLQICRTTEETYPIVLEFLKSFFPEDEPSLHIFNQNTSVMEQTGCVADGPCFDTEDCWALRQGKPYLVDANNTLPACPHVPGVGNGYVCTPLIAQGEMIGLVHLAFGTADPAGNETKQRLASTIADTLALAIANLNLRETLRLQSIQDPLTSLYNRRYMEEILAKEASRSVRRERSFGVLLIDIDHFKRVNDTHGHDVGDAVLRELGAFLASRTRAEDIPCRYGGEEFALIFNEVDQEILEKKAGELCRDIAESVRVPLGGKELRITASIGAALFPEHGTTPAEVIKAADEALYRAKEEGRNRSIMAQPHQEGE